MARRKAARQPRAKSRKAAPAAEVEVLEEEDGTGIDTGIVIATSVLLVAAILCVDSLRGIFDAGMFF